MYKYELHLHTDEVSICGHVPAREQVRRYKELGYTGICVTDHMHQHYFDTYGEGDWQRYIDYHMNGYRIAKEEGDKLGLDVILGTELRFPGSDRDFLIYGIDEKWLRDNEGICRMSVTSFYEKYHNEVLVIHAHPFRYNDEVFPDAVHGIEIANGNPRHDSRNELALQLAIDNPHLLRMAGSDAHRDGDEGQAAILLEERVHHSRAFRDTLLAGAFSVWCPKHEQILRASEEDRQRNPR